jgi:hypothetical protein
LPVIINLEKLLNKQVEKSNELAKYYQKRTLNYDSIEVMIQEQLKKHWNSTPCLDDMPIEVEIILDGNCNIIYRKLFINIYPIKKNGFKKCKCGI